MRGTRNPNAEGHPPLPPFKGGKSEAKGGMLSLQRGEERGEGGMLSLQRGEERGEALEEQANASAFVLRPRAVSRRSSERGERKSGCPKRSELPDFPTCKRREGV